MTDRLTSTDLEVYEAHPPANLFGVSEPAEVVRRASATATALAAVIKQKGLWTEISGKAHVHVEAWTMLGSMLGVFPVVVWTRRLEELTPGASPSGWEARVEARTLGGAIVGAAEAQCDRSEARWKSRDDYALRAMAQTRAVSRAMRAPLGFIVQLAGYDATPAEEMPGEPSGAAAAPSPGSPGSSSAKATQAQHRKLHAMIKEYTEKGLETPKMEGDWEAWSSFRAEEMFGVQSRADLTKAQMSKLIEQLELDSVPFG